jgi:hypothetical protein
MDDEELGAVRDRLLWTLSEHSNWSTERLCQLTNSVGKNTALALIHTCLQSLSRVNSSSIIEGVIAELERASALTAGAAEGYARGMHAQCRICEQLLTALLDVTVSFSSHDLPTFHFYFCA